MTTYQIIKQEGAWNTVLRIILRGRWKGITLEDLAEISELPLEVVANLIQGYDIAYFCWQNKQLSFANRHLTKEEVAYLFNLFEKSQN